MTWKLLTWTWNPGVSVGEFRFGDSAERIIAEIGVRNIDSDEPWYYWETYEIFGYESRFFVEETKITDILSCDQLFINGKNLIGMLLAELREELGMEDRFEEDVGLDWASYYNRLGATFWIVDDVIDSITCGPILDDEAEEDEGGEWNGRHPTG